MSRKKSGNAWQGELHRIGTKGFCLRRFPGQGLTGLGTGPAHIISLAAACGHSLIKT
jgi:hypothetical protein